ncbi:hypothetical protein [Pseudidiomarina sp.]|uniref:hypothetical protein n=1 Tax=Pseudidiomarina sp. TaxID=2081707 RepID=UPI003A96B836
MRIASLVGWKHCFCFLTFALSSSAVAGNVFFPSAERAIALYEQCVDATKIEELEQYEVPARIEAHNAIRPPFDEGTKLIQDTLAEWEQRCLDRKRSFLDQ